MWYLTFEVGCVILPILVPFITQVLTQAKDKDIHFVCGQALCWIVSCCTWLIATYIIQWRNYHLLKGDFCSDSALLMCTFYYKKVKIRNTLIGGGIAFLGKGFGPHLPLKDGFKKLSPSREKYAK